MGWHTLASSCVYKSEKISDMLEIAKGAGTVLVEAVVVGLILSLMMWAVTWKSEIAAWAFVCGGAFHVGCEVTGVNRWYAENYFK